MCVDDAKNKDGSVADYNDDYARKSQKKRSSSSATNAKNFLAIDHLNKNRDPRANLEISRL